MTMTNLLYDNTAAIYARFSSHNQREESIDAQVRACTEYAKTKGFRVVEIYSDSAKSGTNTDREAFQRMIKDSEEHKFKYLLIHKIDRFAREKYDSVVYKRRLKINGVTVISVTENLDGSPESLILEGLLESMAQYYSTNLAREVMKGMKESAYDCKHLGGTPPLGYDVDPETHKYIINEEEARIVRIIFEKYAHDVGYNQLLSYLNRMGYRTKRGKQFGRNSLYSILQNEKYVGKYIFNRKQEKGTSGKRNPTLKPKEEWIVIDNGVPAIVDQQTFDIVQFKMKGNREKAGMYRAREIYLLSGLIICGECGESMYGNTRICGRHKSRYSSYRCTAGANKRGCKNKEIRREYIESYVLDELYERLFSNYSIQKLTAMLNDYNSRIAQESDSDIKRLEKVLAENQRKISNIFNFIMENGFASDTAKATLTALEEEKKLLENQLKEITDKNMSNAISEAIVKELMEKSGEFLRTHKLSECRNFITSYVDKVIIYENKIEVIFKINVIDEQTGEIVPMRSETTRARIMKKYKPSRKGFKRAEAGQN